MKYTWKDAAHYINIYENNPKYGSDRKNFVNYLTGLMQQYRTTSFFDFGCGLNHVVINDCRNIMPDVKYIGYDPAILDSQCTEVLYNYIPEGLNTDMLISSDCLEHVHEDELPQVWDIFKSLQPQIMYHWISTRLAGQLLADGTNAHKSVNSDHWWDTMFKNTFMDYSVENLTTEQNRQNSSAVFLLIRKA